jgi:HSP20 family molecular chaperone IbpA
MKASIHSRDDENSGSFGKTYRVSSTSIQVRCADGALTLSAKENEHYYPSSERFDTVTPPRYVTRTFELELSPREVKRIIDAAVRNGLLSVHPEFAVVERHTRNRGAKG